MNINRSKWPDFVEWWKTYCGSSIDLVDIKDWQLLTDDHGCQLIQSTIECIHDRGSRMPRPKHVEKYLTSKTTSPPPSRLDKSDNAYLKSKEMSPSQLAHVAAGWKYCEEVCAMICADANLCQAFINYLDSHPLAYYYRQAWNNYGPQENRFILAQAGEFYRRHAQK